jgi:hypothetical protein
MGCNQVLPGQLGRWVTSDFLLLFFLQPSLVPVPNRPAEPGFKTIFFNLSFTMNGILRVRHDL